MDNMNFIAILTVSIPEHMLDIIIGLLATGNKKHLIISRSNIYKLIFAILFMTISICSLRAMIPNFLLFLPVVLIIYTLTFLLIYKLNIYNCIVASIIIFSILSMINILLVPPFIMFIEESFMELLRSNLLRFFLSFPERILQILLVIWLWRKNDTIITITRYNNIAKATSICVTIFCIVQIALSYIALEYVLVLSKFILYIIMCLCLLCSIANFLLFNLIKSITNTVSLTVLKEQEYVNNMSFKVLYRLINNNQYSRAQELCKRQINNQDVV